MKKSSLAKIPVQKINNNYLTSVETAIAFFIAANIYTINNTKILALSFFKKKDDVLKLSYRVFFDKKNEEYINQDFTEENFKWRQASISNLLAYECYYWYEQCFVVNEKSTNAILKYFGWEEKPLLNIKRWQEKIQNKRLEKKHRIITDKIDKKMKLVPKLPKSFVKWVDEKALIQSRYIYYEYKSGTKPMKGYCTHCKTDVLVNSPKHNAKGICPNCKSKIIYKAKGKSRNITDLVNVSVIQKVKTGELLVRYFSVNKIYGDNYRDPRLNIFEISRDFHNKDSYKIYEWRNFKQTGNMRWCEGEGQIYYDYSDVCLYPSNLKSVLKGTPWQYSQIKEFATYKPLVKFNTFTYLRKYIKYPFIEYLIKLKLNTLVKEFLFYSYSYENRNTLNLEGKKLTEILKIKKNYLPVLQRLNVSYQELRIIQEMSKLNINLTDEQITFISTELKGKNDIFYVLKYTTIYQAIKYIKKQVKAEKQNEDHIMITWLDYIKACEFLKYDLSNSFNLFPKNLEKSHDEIMKLKKIENRKQLDNLIKGRYESLCKLYQWQCKDYLIVIPKSADEIIKEGQSMHHCVGRLYLEPMAKGETDIVFLRKKGNINESFYTIEIKNGEIRQCRGSHNCAPTPEIIKVKERFKKERLCNINLAKVV